MDQSKNIDRVDEKLDETNKLISIMTGLYDEAGRITATYNPAAEETGIEGLRVIWEFGE